jgi:SAM-dependent methyltransferase
MRICACGSRQVKNEEVWDTRFGKLRMVTCVACGLAREIDDYNYDTYYKKETSCYVTPKVNEESKQFEEFKPVFDFIKKHNLKKGRALDIGCGPGYLLTWLKNEGWKVLGLELNENIACYASSKGADVVCGDFEKIEFKDGAFDLIMLTNSAEHMPHLMEGLAKIFLALKAGGYLFIVVPNYGSLFHRVHDKGMWQILIPGQHIWYFNKKTLKKTCEPFGLETIACRTITHYDPPSQNFFKRIAYWLAVQGMVIFDDGGQIAGLFRKKM